MWFTLQHRLRLQHIWHDLRLPAFWIASLSHGLHHSTGYGCSTYGTHSLAGSCCLCRSSTASCTNLHRLVSKGSRSNLLVRGPSKVNLLARPSFSGTLSTSRRSLDELPSSNNLQSMQDLQSTGRQHSPSPQQLNWYRGDSIRGVDREFIYKVGFAACTAASRQMPQLSSWHQAFVVVAAHSQIDSCNNMS